MDFFGNLTFCQCDRICARIKTMYRYRGGNGQQLTLNAIFELWPPNFWTERERERQKSAIANLNWTGKYRERVQAWSLLKEPIKSEFLPPFYCENINSIIYDIMIFRFLFSHFEIIVGNLFFLPHFVFLCEEKIFSSFSDTFCCLL